MNLNAINWWAVIVCVIVGLISGALWFNPKTFFPAWWKVVGKENQSPGMQNMAMTWTLTVLSLFLQATAMAFMVNSMGSLMGGPNLVTGASTGFMLWLGFIVPTYLVNKLFAGHGLKIWAIEVGLHLIDFVLFGAILGAWR